MDMERVNKWRFRLALAAEAMDYFRIVPRAIVIGYSVMLYEVVKWFMALPTPNMEQSALVSVVVTIAGVVIGLYTKSGHSWDNPLTVWTKEPQLRPKANHSTNGINDVSSTEAPLPTPPDLTEFPDID